MSTRSEREHLRRQATTEWVDARIVEHLRRLYYQESDRYRRAALLATATRIEEDDHE